MTRTLTFLHTVIDFEVAPAAEAAFAPIARFFRHLLGPETAASQSAVSTHSPVSSQSPPTFHIAVEAFDPDADVAPEVWAVPQSVIRRSSAAEFTFDAHVVEADERRRYINRGTVVDVPFEVARDNGFRLRITEASTVQIIDFVRDLIIRHEEDLGTVDLHASGIRDADRAVAIAGSKGAGKTTTMLSALRDPAWRYFTGDKMFCTVEDGVVYVHPWRDYPYVGVGTIRAHADLTAFIRDTVDPGLDARAPGEKILIDPDLFEGWLGTPFSAEPLPLAAIWLPEVRPGEPLTVRRISSAGERWAWLNKIVDRQADTTFFTWQTHLVPDYQRFFRSLAELQEPLAGVDLVRLRGELDIAPDALLPAAAGTAVSA
jgi:hypothetical protein